MRSTSIVSKRSRDAECEAEREADARRTSATRLETTAWMRRIRTWDRRSLGMWLSGRTWSPPGLHPMSSHDEGQDAVGDEIRGGVRSPAREDGAVAQSLVHVAEE